MAAEDIKTDANHVESHDPVVAVENPNITFRDVWENRRVLGFCKSRLAPQEVNVTDSD